MKFLVQLILTLLLVWLLRMFLPWWSLAIGCLLMGALFANNGGASFLAGFLAVAVLWFGMAFYMDYSTQSILTDKVALLFPTQTKPLLFVVTALVGGLVGGFAALSGALFTYKKKRKW